MILIKKYYFSMYTKVIFLEDRICYERKMICIRFLSLVI